MDATKHLFDSLASTTLKWFWSDPSKRGNYRTGEAPIEALKRLVPMWQRLGSPPTSSKGV